MKEGSEKQSMKAGQAQNVALAQAPNPGVPRASASHRIARYKHSLPLILILYTDKQHAVQLRSDLVSAGYEVDTVATDVDAKRRLRETAPDLIVLDFEMRDLNGDLARLRGYVERATPPIMILVPSESDGLRGLFAGADDFVTKPISSIHLIARVQALLRRPKHRDPGPVDARRVLRIQDVEVNLESHRVTRAGRDIHLGPTEYRILIFFMRHPGRIFSRQRLLKAIWGDRPNTAGRTVDVYISRLGRALDRGFRESAIQSVRGVGYGMHPNPAVAE